MDFKLSWTARAIADVANEGEAGMFCNCRPRIPRAASLIFVVLT
jgi:hypothetical protein